MDSRTTKSLKISLFSLITFSFITLVQIFVNIVEQRPIWLVALFILSLPIFIFTIIMISLDLIKQDHITVVGRLIEKKDIYKGYKIKARMNDGNVKNFRINRDIDEVIKDLELDQNIEMTYYRRTKAVTNIKRC